MTLDEQLPSPAEICQLAETVHEKWLAREQRKLERLDKLLEFAACDQCKMQYLVAYFGEKKEEPCGHCSFCQLDRGKEVEDGMVLGPATQSELTKEELKKAGEVFSLWQDQEVVSVMIQTKHEVTHLWPV